MKQAGKLIGCIDQSTTATKFLVFDYKGNQIEKSIVSHKQITPKSGWLEHDALEILNNTKMAINQTVEKIKEKGYTEDSISSIGITNQRETVVAWNRNTGKPYHHAIVWNDQRTADICQRWTGKHKGNPHIYSKINGLPINTYFSAFKIRWLIENIPDIQEEDPDDVLYGNMNTWLLWNLTDRVHATDVSNASRTFLMNLETLQYEQKILDEFGIDKLSLPEIRSCAENYGKVTFGPLKGIPITSMLGDQQAASIGHGLFEQGGSKITYGSGCFLLANQGTEPQYQIEKGLLTTLQYKFGDSKPHYAFEGAIETGALTLNWARDKIGLFQDFKDLDEQVLSVKDNGGVYFVPTLSGAYSPYWNADATGMVIGMSFFTERGHLLRALLESIAFRTKDVLDEIEKTNIKVEKLNVDGGVTTNEFLMQFQSDLIQKPLVKSKVMDSTCLGATLAAGIGSGVYKNMSEIQDLIEMEKEIQFNKEYKKTAEQIYGKWQQAIPKAFDWKK